MSLTPPGAAPETVVFVPWPDHELDAHNIPVDGAYSRAAWLPELGAMAWRLWVAVARRLRDEGSVRCGLVDLLPGEAVNPVAVAQALSRLAAFGLADSVSADTWAVRTLCPPLYDRLLARRPSPVHAIHIRTFPDAAPACRSGEAG